MTAHLDRQALLAESETPTEASQREHLRDRVAPAQLLRYATDHHVPMPGEEGSEVVSLRRELDDLRTQLRKHQAEHRQLTTLVQAILATMRPDEGPAPELTPEARAELDRLRDWPFVDEYPTVGGSE